MLQRRITRTSSLHGGFALPVDFLPPRKRQWWESCRSNWGRKTEEEAKLVHTHNNNRAQSVLPS